MDKNILNKQVEFTLNGKGMTGVVIKLGVFNPDYCVVNVDTTKKREDLRWVKIEDCKVI